MPPGLCCGEGGRVCQVWLRLGGCDVTRVAILVAVDPATSPLPPCAAKLAIHTSWSYVGWCWLQNPPTP